MQLRILFMCISSFKLIQIDTTDNNLYGLCTDKVRSTELRQLCLNKILSNHEGLPHCSLQVNNTICCHISHLVGSNFPVHFCANEGRFAFAYSGTTERLLGLTMLNTKAAKVGASSVGLRAMEACIIGMSPFMNSYLYAVIQWMEIEQKHCIRIYALACSHCRFIGGDNSYT